jgi:hypothetical protein
METKHIIFSVDEISKIDFNDVLELNETHLWKSKDNTKTYVRYQGSLPESLQQLTTIEATLSYLELYDLIQKEEWIAPSPIF